MGSPRRDGERGIRCGTISLMTAPVKEHAADSITRDLREKPPPNPRETLDGFIIAVHMLEKARGCASA